MTIDPPKIAAEAIVGAVAQKLAADQVLVEIVSASGPEVAAGSLTAQRTPERYHALISSRRPRCAQSIWGRSARSTRRRRRCWPRCAIRRGSRWRPPRRALRACGRRSAWAHAGLCWPARAHCSSCRSRRCTTASSTALARASRSPTSPPAAICCAATARATRDAIIVAALTFLWFRGASARAGAARSRARSRRCPARCARRRRSPFCRPLRRWVGAAATEGFLRELSAPGILHIATHGLFASGSAQGGGRALELSWAMIPPPPPSCSIPCALRRW